MKNIITLKNYILTTLIVLLGGYWYLFIGYLLLNIIDWITGSLKAIKLKELSSYIGIKGLIKKIGYWIIIGISFYLSYSFAKLGNNILGINLSIMYLLGWFTLASLTINEALSILENLSLLNIKIPSFLMKSLKSTKKILDNAEKPFDNRKNKKL
jgi:toxin secretion/phage lysis holin